MGCFLKSVILAVLIFLGLGFLLVSGEPQMSEPDVFSITAVPYVTEAPIGSNQMTATAIIQNATASQAAYETFQPVAQTMTMLASTNVPTLPPTWTPTSTITATPTQTP